MRYLKPVLFALALLLGGLAVSSDAQVAIQRGWNTISGHILFSPDNTWDFGANGATRPANIYAANDISGLRLLVNGSIVGSASDGVVRFSNNADTVATRVNSAGAPSLSSCGDGALATGSNNSVGRVTGTTQTACTLTFSASFGGNAADCIVENLTANRGFVSAASSTAFTVSTLTAGDDFMYICLGR